MKSYLSFGLGIGCFYFAGNLLEFLLVFQGEYVKWCFAISWVMTVAAAVGIYLGIRAVRARSANKVFSYRRGLYQGIMTSLFWGLTSTALGLIYAWFFLDANLVEQTVKLEHNLQVLKNLGIPFNKGMENGLSAGIRFVGLYQNPVTCGVLEVARCVLEGMLYTLAFAWFLRRKART